MLLIFLLAALGAIIPTAIYVTIAWWLDRYEREPLWLLALTFLWGAVPAIILAAIAEWAAMAPMMMSDPEGMSGMVMIYAVVAPLVEESLKAIPLLFIFFLFRREFDGLMDGLLYGAIVGFGFAMTENFFYIFGAGMAQGLPAEALVFFLRTIVFGMMHALWSSMFGIGLGIARYSKSAGVGFAAAGGGLMLGMLLHGLHNFSAVSAGAGGMGALLFPMVMLASYGAGCFAWLLLVYFAGRTEASWIRDELAEEVASGLLTSEQAFACGRYRSRIAARWAAWKEHGLGHAHQLGRCYCLGTELAFKKRQLMINPAESRNGEAIERLRHEIRELQGVLDSAGTATESG